jgi:hypothetical protein
MSDIMSINQPRKSIAISEDFYNDFRSRFMAVENFSLNPDFLNIQYLPVEPKMQRDIDLYGYDPTIPNPLKLVSKSPIYGPGLIIQNGVSVPLSLESSLDEASDGSKDLIAMKAKEEEKRALLAKYAIEKERN